MNSTDLAGADRRRLLRFSIGAASILAVLAMPGSALAAPPTQQELAALPSAAQDYCVEPEELAFLAAINSYRTQNGLQPLQISQTLGAAAAKHSDNMAATSYFDHTMSDGTTVEQNIRAHGYTGQTYGENIVAGTESADFAFSTFQGSAPHNQNMLQASYQSIGIARSYNAASEQGWYWTTIFGGPLDVPADVCGEPPGDTAFADAAAAATLNLRSGPGRDFAVVTEVPDGAPLDVTGTEEAGYVPVAYSGFTGWVAADYVRESGAAASDVAGTAPITGNGARALAAVNLRSGPGLTHEVLSEVPAGADLTVNGVVEAGFLPVSYNGQAGWVATEFVDQETAPAPTAATTTQPLNLRAGPSATDPILLVIPAAAEVSLTGAVEGGYLGVTFGTTQGWADAAYLSTTVTAPDQLAGFAPAATAQTGEVMATANLNLRADAGPDSAILTVVPRGSTMVVTDGETVNGYVPVTYNGTSGWVDAAYLG